MTETLDGNGSLKHRKYLFSIIQQRQNTDRFVLNFVMWYIQNAIS